MFRTNRSIRFKFTIAFALFVAITLCIFSTVLYILYSHQVRQNIEKSLHFIVEQSIRNFFDEHDKFHLHTQNEPDQFSQFVILQVYKKGNLLYSSHDIPWQNKEYPLHQYVEIKNGKVLVLSKPFSREYTIRAFYLQSNEISQLNSLIIILIALVIMSVLFSVIGSWHLSFRLLTPFRKIAEDASRISTKNFDEKLKFSVKNDEVGQLCTTLNKLFDRLKKSFSTLQKFTSNASHELKTPLTIMRGDIEVLLRKKRTPEEYEQTLLCTLDEIDRMYRLIQGLLLLSQAEGDEIELDNCEICLVDIVACAKHNIGKIHRNSDITLHETMDDSVFVWGNSIWIQQIIENLMNNAFQNTPQKGDIYIKVEQSIEYAIFHIRNSGDGILQEDAPFIFDRFYRIVGSGAGGFGLGLAICKALAEKHGGRIEFSSVPRQETKFSLYLPLKK
ncbi:ATP-binding protein [Candidatus Uabimicrobium amorphum]|uniref:histidine kinase n=1 Tax=Uabimicrobium amorphum TaxID=2596890 RepID=A0A5S9IMI3_UABAM|nr:ATP-binding protein [Candidatus Uabimicrobium amorphum]BBM84257.1 two-component sensor histidine kinase [Candidatus Uabimicrobium amorphum]